MKRALFQLQYEIPRADEYTEQGTEHGARLTVDDIDDPAVRATLGAAHTLSYREWLRWLQEHRESMPTVAVLPLTSTTPESARYRIGNRKPRLTVVTRPLQTIEGLNEYLYTLNDLLDNNDLLLCHAMSARLKRELVMRRYPWGIAHGIAAWNYLWHRVCPKLRLTRNLYFTLTHGKDRTFNRVEILGRLYRAGFEVEDEGFIHGEFFITARKAMPPVDDTPPTGSPIIHLRRIGKGGKEIVVHKFRTMYTYSEYIQPYIFLHQKLAGGGKFKDDYRVNFWGRLMRSLWLDELPMAWNLIRGDIKLVGVRPLSPHYFSLYSKEMQELRIKTKPGLLPPFYYERTTPVTLDEVQESERRYIEAYLKKPFATDWRYFWGIVGNIVLRRKRSK